MKIVECESNFVSIRILKNENSSTFLKILLIGRNFPTGMEKLIEAYDSLISDSFGNQLKYVLEKREKEYILVTK
jgi:hypothetical protein